MAEKKKPLAHGLGDDSGEMDIIKDIFAGEEPTGGTTDIFASDIFAADPFAPAPAQTPEPQPEPKPEAKPPAPAAGIKVVTDKDLKQFLADSPAKPAPAPAPAAPPAPPPKPAPPVKPAPAPAAEPESLEFQAVAEEIQAFGAAKKGAALAEVAHELDGLEPMGDDFMSIEEMKKLFGNVNAMREAISRLCKRIDRIEEALERLGAPKPEKQ